MIQKLNNNPKKDWIILLDFLVQSITVTGAYYSEWRERIVEKRLVKLFKDVLYLQNNAPVYK